MIIPFKRKVIANIRRQQQKIGQICEYPDVEHDLEKSGLKWCDVKEHGWHVISTSEVGAFNKLKETIGFTSYNGCSILKACNHILVIPYPQTNYSRVRLYPPLDGTKYLQPSGITPSPYILPEVAGIKDRPHKPVIITEGEKKALCLLKHGFNAIGLPGVWCFKNKRQDLPLLKELEEWNWKGRTVHICFDSDAVFNPNVIKAEIELSLNLYARGAKVFIVRLPQPDHQTKLGVDDFVTQEGIDAFKKLYKAAKPFALAYTKEYMDSFLNRLVNVEMNDFLSERLQIDLRKNWKISKGDLNNLLRLKIKEKETNAPDRTPYTPKEEAEAERLLKEPNILEKMLAFTEKAGHVGEKANKKVLFLSAVSTKTDKAVNIFVKGSSSSGKNALVDTIRALLPVEVCKKFSGISEKALYHTEDKDLSHKILYIAEIEGSSQADYPVRLVMSEGELSYTYTVKDLKTGEFTTKNEYIKALGTAIWQTTTSLVVTTDNENRAIDLYIDESEEHTRAILRKQAEQINEINNNNYLEKGKRIWQCAFSKIEPLPVVIPYAEFLAERYPTDKIRSRRDFPKLLTLIASHTLLYQKQRPKNEEGKLIATVEDYEEVYNLCKTVFNQTLCELSPKEEEILKKIEENFGNNWFSIKDCNNLVKENYEKVRSYIRALARKGYLAWNEEKGPRSGYMIEKYPDEAFALPTPQEIEKCLNQATLIPNSSQVSDIPRKKIRNMENPNYSLIPNSTQISEKGKIRKNGVPNYFSRNIGKIGIIRKAVIGNKEKKSSSGYLVVKPFAWSGEEYSTGDSITTDSFTEQQLKVLEDAGHIRHEENGEVI